MIKDRLMLDSLVEGVPATWHRNACSPSASSPNTGNRQSHSVPTQLVYPNGSFNIGLKVESVNLDHYTHVHAVEDHATDDSRQTPVIVYSSPKKANIQQLYPVHRPLMISWAIYVILTLLLAPRVLNSEHATGNSNNFIWLCWISILDWLIFMCAIWKYGYKELMRLNTNLLVGGLIALVLYAESVYSVVLFSVHGLVIIAGSYTLGKCTSKVFIVSEM